MEKTELKLKNFGPGDQTETCSEIEPNNSQIARDLAVDKLDIRRLIQLDACTRCGECLNWCPVYDQDAREAVIPRSKILDFLNIVRSQNSLFGNVLKNGEAGSFFNKAIKRLFNVSKITEEIVIKFADNLYECSTCGQCRVVCPANINTVELWEDIRKLIVEAGYGPLKPQKVLVKSVKSYDNPWQQPRQARTKWARRAKKDGLIQALPKEIKKTKGKILLFFGCTAVYDVNVRQIAVNTVNIFEALDIDYGCLGGEEKCCGSVLLRMGDTEFERIASDNIRQINSLGIEKLVTSCSGCYKTLKDDYPKVDRLNFQVMHIVEYLKELMDRGILKFKNPIHKKVTFHDPCHLGRIAGVFDAPRTILKAIPGIELNEMERIKEYSRCCGAGGGVKAGFPDIQSKMALRRIQEAEATGAEDLISACPFCYAGLQVGIKAMDSKIVMKDVTTLVAESLLGYDVFVKAAEEADKKIEERAAKKAERERKKAEKETVKEKGKIDTDDAKQDKTDIDEEKAERKAAREKDRAEKKAAREKRRAEKKAAKEKAKTEMTPND